MRCPDCGKFVAYDTDVEPEEQGETTLEGNTLNGEYERVLNCAECGTQLKSTTITIEAEVDLGDVPEECPKAENKEHDWSLDLTAEATTRTETGRWKEAKRASTRKEPVTVRRGTRKDGEPNEIATKKVKPGDVVFERWRMQSWRTYYGVSLSGEATCQNCGATVAIEGIENDEAASGFNEDV